MLSLSRKSNFWRTGQETRAFSLRCGPLSVASAFECLATLDAAKQNLMLFKFVTDEPLYLRPGRTDRLAITHIKVNKVFIAVLLHSSLQIAIRWELIPDFHNFKQSKPTALPLG